MYIIGCGYRVFLNTNIKRIQTTNIQYLQILLHQSLYYFRYNVCVIAENIIYTFPSSSLLILSNIKKVKNLRTSEFTYWFQFKNIFCIGQSISRGTLAFLYLTRFAVRVPARFFRRSSSTKYVACAKYLVPEAKNQCKNKRYLRY